jgi:hypothetical protein
MRGRGLQSRSLRTAEPGPRSGLQLGEPSVCTVLVPSEWVVGLAWMLWT